MSLLKRVILAISILLVVLAGSVFAIRNSDYVAVDFLFGATEWPLSAIVVIVFIVGSLLGFFVGIANIFKLHAANKLLERKLNKSAQGKGSSHPLES